MASVGDLLRRLHLQAWELSGTPTTPATEARLDGQLRGWVRVAASASRALAPLRHRPDLDDVLDQLADGGLATPGRPAARLAALSQTIGAIGDILASRGPDIERAGTATKDRLHASVQAALHAAARATLTVAQQVGHPEAEALMSRLAEATEMAAMIPPSARTSRLDHLAIIVPGPQTLQGAVEQWARTATTVLSSQTQVTGYVLQSTAANIALLCLATARATKAAAADGPIAQPVADHAVVALQAASRAWRNAAAWPPHLRLGGRSAEYRRASNDLLAALSADLNANPAPGNRFTELLAALPFAGEVARAHQLAAERLADAGGVWVSGESLMSTPQHHRAAVAGLRRSSWIMEQPGQHAAEPIAAASRAAGAALHAALASLNAAANSRSAASFAQPPPVPVWETVTARPSPSQERFARPNAPRLPGFAL
jgi:hypothetical protein